MFIPHRTELQCVKSRGNLFKKQFNQEKGTLACRAVDMFNKFNGQQHSTIGVQRNEHCVYS